MDQPSIEGIKSSLKKNVSLKSGRIIQNLNNSGKDIDKRYRVLLLKTAIFQVLPTLK